MAEEARRRAGKGTGQGESESSHPFKGKGKGPGKAQQKGGKGKSGPGGGPATPSAVRLDPLLEAAYQLYIAGRRADQPRVSRNAWLRNNMRSDSALRAELRERMRAAHHAPRASTQPAAPQTGESVSTTPRQPPPPPRPRPRVTHDQREASSTAASSTDAPPAAPAPAQAESSTSSSSSEQQAHPPGPSPCMVQKDGEENNQCQKRGQRTALHQSSGGAGLLGARGDGGGRRLPSFSGA